MSAQASDSGKGVGCILFGFLCNLAWAAANAQLGLYPQPLRSACPPLPKSQRRLPTLFTYSPFPVDSNSLVLQILRNHQSVNPSPSHDQSEQRLVGGGITLRPHDTSQK